MKNQVALLGLLLAVWSGGAARAECPKWERLSQAGQKAVEAGDYNRGEQIWSKATIEAENCGERDPAGPLSFKRLGECLLKNGKYVDAGIAFQKAVDLDKINGTDDAELTSDLVSLSKVYRTIAFSELNKSVADAFKESGVNLIGLCKLDQGNRIQMNLNDKFTKQIDNKDVDQLSLEKLVSFDVLEQPDGSLTISNIKGLRVHAHMWVTIVQSLVHPQNPDGASAEVTATKMGITKTVSCKLPSDSIDPMNALIAKLHDFNGTTTASTSASTPAINANSVINATNIGGATPSDTSGAATSVTPAIPATPEMSGTTTSGTTTSGTTPPGASSGASSTDRP